MNTAISIILFGSAFISVYILVITTFRIIKYYFEQCELFIRISKSHKFIMEEQELINKKIDDLKRQK